MIPSPPPPPLITLATLGFSLAAATILAAGPAQAADKSVDVAESPVRGIVKPVHQATLASELQARVARLPFREGERFNQGDLLVEFECDKYRSEVQVAAAELKSATATRDNTHKLLQLGAAGRFDVDVSDAQAEKAQAALATAQTLEKRCRVYAPFSGRILDLAVHEQDMPGTNGALMKIADDRSLEIELIAPSSWLRWLKPGIPFTLELDDTGVAIAAQVRQIGAAVDAVSQTIKLSALVTQPSLEGVLPGMSGTAHFPVPER